MRRAALLLPVFAAATWAQSNLTLSGLSPSFGLEGNAVEVTATGTGFTASFSGTAFFPGSTLIWRRNNQETVLSTTFVNSTTLRTTIPASLMTGAPAIASILVENRGNCNPPNCPRSAARTFAIDPNFQLTRITPDRGSVGTSVTITATGSGFRQSAGIIFRRGSIEQRLTTNFISVTTLTATIPASLTAVAGVADILVENGTTTICEGPCARSSALPFTIIGLLLTRLDPNRAPTRLATGPAQDFSLLGQGFAPNAQVFWQSTPTAVPLELRVVARGGTTQIDSQIPASLLTQPLVANVFVRNPETEPVSFQFPGARLAQAARAVDSLSLPFTVFVPLRLDRLEPNAAPAGSPATRMTAFGAGFTANTRIAFRDSGGTRTPAGQTVNTALGTIELTVGAELLAVQKTWEVIAVDGTSVSDPVRFDVTAGVTITSINPTSRAVGSGTFELTVNGNGFNDTAVILFGDQTITPTARTATQLRANVTAPNAAGPVDVRVRVGSGANTLTSNVVRINFTAGPSITSLSPSTRAANSGDFDLTITGQNFLPEPSVTFGGQSVSIVGTPTATSITVRIPNARIQQPGAAAVVVRVSGADSAPVDLQVTGTPAITSLSPSSRPVNSGDFDLTIAGQNFLPAPTVTFGGQSVSIIGTPTATSITVRVPNARIQQTGPQQVVVRVNNVNSQPSTFQVTAGGPTITSLNPPSRPAGSGDFTLTINGQNLTPSPSVTFGGQAVNVTGTPTATAVQVQVPNSLLQTVRNVQIQVQVAGQSANSQFAVTAPEVPTSTVSSAAVNVAPGGNTTATVTLSGAAPVPVQGTLELSFTPNAAGLPANFVDPALVFVNGGQRRVNFTIAPGQTNAAIPGGGAFNVGTVAGTVTLRVVSMTAAGVDQRLPDPRTVTIPRAAPSIQQGSARLTNTPGGVTVELQGFSPGREITQASVTFTIASGVNVSGSTNFTVQLQQAFTAFFGSDTGRNSGSRFLLQIPFTVPEGDPNQITGFSITLTGPDGTSAAVTGGR